MFGPRSSPLYFAGREAELSLLRDRLSCFLSEDRRHVAEDGLQLVVGVPGSGKSALLRRFGELVANKADVLRMGPSRLTADSRAFFLDLADVAGLSDEARLIAEAEPRTTGYQLKTPVGGGGRQIQSERVTHDIESMLAKLSAKWDGGRPLVMLIDELHQADERAASHLQVLHNGLHGCPIMVVGAGLQHTPHRLSAMGISRMAEPMRLHTLSEMETREAFIENAMSGAGVDNIPDAVLGRLVEGSQCFPVHIQGYLAGIAKVAAAESPDMLRDDAAVRSAIRHGDECRAAYYNGRLAAMQGAGVADPHVALAPIVDALQRQSALRRGEAEELCGDSGELVVGSAIAHGVLRDDVGKLDFGIPSFMDYMAAERNRMQQAGCTTNLG